MASISVRCGHDVARLSPMRRQQKWCVPLPDGDSKIVLSFVSWDTIGMAEARTANLDPEIETLHLGWPSYPTNCGLSTYGLLCEREIVPYF